MIFQHTKILSEEAKIEVRKIWNREYPKVIFEKSQEKFNAYIASLKNASHTLVLDDNSKILGWFADFEREDDRWFLILLSSTIQGTGIGKELMQKAQQKHNRLNGWAIFSDNYEKTDGTFYKNPIAFYEKLGFIIRKDIIFETEIMNTLKIEWQKHSL